MGGELQVHLLRILLRLCLVQRLAKLVVRRSLRAACVAVRCACCRCCMAALSAGRTAGRTAVCGPCGWCMRVLHSFAAAAPGDRLCSHARQGHATGKYL